MGPNRLAGWRRAARALEAEPRESSSSSHNINDIRGSNRANLQEGMWARLRAAYASGAMLLGESLCVSLLVYLLTLGVHNNYLVIVKTMTMVRNVNIGQVHQKKSYV